MPKSLRNLKLLAFTFVLVSLCASISTAQSTDQNFPTPVHVNEISGVIKARDIGDSRLTSHYFTFEGGQGDLFINVQTANFSGDVDVFAMPGLRPLTKMVMYAESNSSETGRVVYLRKPETILLRIQGRTPGDEEASYRVKFAGSFLASKTQDVAPEVPKVDTETRSNVRVNSVGTILEVIPKATPAALEESAPVAEEAASEPAKKADEEVVTDSARKNKVSQSDELPPRQGVVITDPLAEKKMPETDKANESVEAPARRNSRSRRNNRRESDPRKEQEAKSIESEVEDQMDRSVTETDAVPEKEPKASKNSKAARPKPIDPMAGINLVIRFKNGGVIERPMTEVSKFTVERAVLTVISKDGSVGRYPMIEVSGVTIE